MTDFIRGIDVSDIQEPTLFNYHAARMEGFEFLVAKLSDGIDTDSAGSAHLLRARDAGLICGGYHFFIPWRPVDNQLEAFKRAAALANYGRDGDMAPWLDIESWKGKSGNHQAAPSWSQPAFELAKAIKDHFGRVLIYINQADYVAMGRPGWIKLADLVVAHYGVPAGQPWAQKWLIHQHKVERVEGVYSGPIDQNVAKRPLPLLNFGTPAGEVSSPTCPPAGVTGLPKKVWVVDGGEFVGAYGVKRLIVEGVYSIREDAEQAAERSGGRVHEREVQ